MSIAPPPFALPRVPVIDPPATLPSGLALPTMQGRTVRGGQAWFREMRIPPWASHEFKIVWKQHKLEFLNRGFSLRQVDGFWVLQQWLSGGQADYTLTDIGAERVARALNPQATLPVEVEAPAVTLDLPPLPNGLESFLYEYQRQPARQLFRAVMEGKAEWGYAGAWDCSDLGTGKTYQALAAALATGLEVGVICPKSVMGTYPKYGGAGSGWLGAFAHFKQKPAFVLNYESLRTGNREVIRRIGTGRSFEWALDPQHTILIWDEAHNCFPSRTMITTDLGRLPICQIVEHRLKIRVLTVDISTGKTTYRNVTGHFKNRASQLVRVTHERGEFTCTATHKIWTRKGWYQAERLERGSELRVLRQSICARGEKSNATVLRKEVLEDVHDASGPYGNAHRVDQQGHSSKGHGADNGGVYLPGMWRVLQTENPEELPVQQSLCGTLSVEAPGPDGLICQFDQGGQETGIRRGIPQSIIVADEGTQPDAPAGERGEDDEIHAGSDVSGARRERATDGSAEDCRRGDGPADGISDRDSGQCEGTVPESANEIQRGPRGTGSEAGNRDRRADSPAEEVALSGQAEDRYTCFSRVVSVEVLESGSGHGPSGGGGEDYLYDLEVEGTHCYFADGVLVHNCKNASLNRSMAFAAIRQGFPCLFVSGTMAATPLNLGATGIAVGLHRGDRAGYERFLSEHGCRTVVNGLRRVWDFPKGRAGAVHLARIHRKVFPLRGARVKIADLGHRFPETQILCEAVQTEDTAAIAKAWLAANDTITKLEEQGMGDGQLKMLSQSAYMAAWHESERVKVPTIVEMSRREIEEGRSVAIFVNFTDVREALMHELKTQCAIFGGQSQKNRDKCLADFQGGKARVIVCNIKAGGVGVSLHDVDGEFPRTAIILPTNNAVEMGQALGRVHRAGGKSRSRQLVVFAAGTIEEGICSSTRRKLSAIATLNDGDLEPNSKF